MHSTRSITIALTLLLCATSVRAQDVPARLTLEQALEIARERNPQYRKALNELRSAAALERQRWGAFLPSADVNLSAAGSGSRTLTGEDDFGRPISEDEAKTIVRSSARQTLSLGITLFDGLRGLNQLRSAHAASRATGAALAAAAAGLESTLVQRFYDALNAQRLITLEERLLESARDRLEANREMLRVAKTTPADVLGAEVDVARQEQQVERARGEARKRRLLLRESMGLDRHVEFELVGELPELFDPTVLAADDLVAAALAANPAVLQRRAVVEQATHAAGAARAGRWPTIRLSGGLSGGTSRSGYDALTAVTPENRGFNFNVSASLPLFNRFQTSYEVTQADVSRVNAEQDLRAVRLQVEREVRSALIDLENAYRAVRLAERSAELSRRRVEMAQERYRLGGGSFAELQLVIEQAAEAERNAVQARLTFANAAVVLEEKVGRPVRP